MLTSMVLRLRSCYYQPKDKMVVSCADLVRLIQETSLCLSGNLHIVWGTMAVMVESHSPSPISGHIRPWVHMHLWFKSHY